MSKTQLIKDLEELVRDIKCLKMKCDDFMSMNYLSLIEMKLHLILDRHAPTQERTK